MGENKWLNHWFFRAKETTGSADIYRQIPLYACSHNEVNMNFRRGVDSDFVNWSDRHDI